MAREVSVVFEDMDEETLEQMPEWFKRLREGHLRRAQIRQASTGRS